MNDELMLQAELAVLEAQIALASVKANPYHDPKDGKFTGKQGGAAYGWLSPEQRAQRLPKAKREAMVVNAGGQGQKPASSKKPTKPKASVAKKPTEPPVPSQDHSAAGYAKKLGAKGNPPEIITPEKAKRMGIITNSVAYQKRVAADLTDCINYKPENLTGPWKGKGTDPRRPAKPLPPAAEDGTPLSQEKHKVFMSVTMPYTLNKQHNLYDAPKDKFEASKRGHNDNLQNRYGKPVVTPERVSRQKAAFDAAAQEYMNRMPKKYHGFAEIGLTAHPGKPGKEGGWPGWDFQHKQLRKMTDDFDAFAKNYYPEALDSFWEKKG